MEFISKDAPIRCVLIKTRSQSMELLVDDCIRTLWLNEPKKFDSTCWYSTNSKVDADGETREGKQLQDSWVSDSGWFLARYFD